jgi:hypothetical protein
LAGLGADLDEVPHPLGRHPPAVAAAPFGELLGRRAGSLSHAAPAMIEPTSAFRHAGLERRSGVEVVGGEAVEADQVADQLRAGVGDHRQQHAALRVADRRDATGIEIVDHGTGVEGVGLPAVERCCAAVTVATLVPADDSVPTLHQQRGEDVERSCEVATPMGQNDRRAAAVTPFVDRQPKTGDDDLTHPVGRAGASEAGRRRRRHAPTVSSSRGCSSR